MLSVNVATQEVAWDLQPRLRDFNRNYLLPVIERVLDELAVAGRQIRIPALHLDLGQLPREGFEVLAAERLDHELRKALSEAIAGANREGDSGFQSQSEDESRLDSLEHYLQFGKLPFWGAPAASFSLETALQELLERDASGVHRLIRNLGGRPWAIQRLVFQLSESTLERLLNLLQPKSAALIVATLLELRDILREVTVPAVSDSKDASKFVSLLRVFAFAYVLRDPSSPFNRRRFVGYLLSDIANHESLDLHKLLFSLESAVTRLEKGHLLDSPLPAIIRELMRENEIARPGSSDKTLPVVKELVSPSDSSLPTIIRELVREEKIARPESSGEPLSATEELASPPDSSFPTIIRKLVQEKEIARARSSDEALLVAEQLSSPSDSSLPAIIRELMREKEIARARSSDEALLAAEQLSSPSDSSLPAIIRELMREEESARLGSSDEPLPAAEQLSSPSDSSLPAIIRELMREKEIARARSSDAALLAAEELISPSDSSLPAIIRELMREKDARLGSSDEPLPAAEQLPSPSDSSLPAIIRELVREKDALPGSSGEPLPATQQLISPLDSPLPTIIRELMRGNDARPGSSDETLPVVKELVSPSDSSPPTILRELAQEEGIAHTASSDELWPVAEELVSSLPATIGAMVGKEQFTGPDSPVQEPRPVSRELISPSLAEVSILTEESILARIKKLLPQTGETANVFLTALFAHAAGVEDKRAFYFNVLRARQEGRVLDLEELSKTSSEERAIFPRLESAGEAVESTADDKIGPQADQNVDEGESQPKMPGTATPRFPKRFAKRQELPRPEKEHPHVPAIRTQRAFSMTEAQPLLPVGEAIYIDNAGLVLTAPFLPMLFNSLNMLRKNENDKIHWTHQESASRAVHLLQYLVDERVNAPEPLLVLNKLLCGLPLAMPVEKSITMTERELETCRKLMRSMLANWKALSGTSIAGMRETFFQRQGRLEQSDMHWKLQIQRKTVDVLVDQIPWSISVIFHAWMPGPLHVTW